MTEEPKIEVEDTLEDLVREMDEINRAEIWRRGWNDAALAIAKAEMICGSAVTSISVLAMIAGVPSMTMTLAGGITLMGAGLAAGLSATGQD